MGKNRILRWRKNMWEWGRETFFVYLCTLGQFGFWARILVGKISTFMIKKSSLYFLPLQLVFIPLQIM
jgi:hypothetical protein